MNGRLLASGLAALLVTAPVGVSAGVESESRLRELIAQHELLPLDPKPFEVTPKYLLGQALFFDPILSGSRSIACASCHRIDNATVDGRQVAMLPDEYMRAGHPVGAVLRNTPDLFNRDHDSVTSLFWDGRVQADIWHGNVRFQSPQGVFSHDDVENLLALQALTPITTVHEMLGNAQMRTSAGLPAAHAAKVNDVADVPAFETDAMRAISAASRLVDRLLGRGASRAEAWHREYRQLFDSAYGRRSLSEYTFADVGNALAHFQEMAFATRETRWDRYLTGNASALSESEKRGAIYFFGEGRCSGCHSGALLSDFRYHAVLRVSVESALPDLGRYSVTGQEDDKHSFRTPPLRNVTLTAPYFHDGSAPTLRAALEMHFPALRAAAQQVSNASTARALEHLPADCLRQAYIADLVEFLHALEDSRAHALGRFRPATVPSRLPSLKAEETNAVENGNGIRVTMYPRARCYEFPLARRRAHSYLLTGLKAQPE